MFSSRLTPFQTFLLVWFTIITFATITPSSKLWDILFWRPGGKADLTSDQSAVLGAGLRKCSIMLTAGAGSTTQTSNDRTNPRWLSARGGNDTILLQNATLFDGSTFLPGTVDILIERGVILSVSPASQESPQQYERMIDLQGRYVTPGLVDMHAHHYIGSWPALPSTDDVNEFGLPTGPITPFLRAIDSLKPGDAAALQIASGGVTSSLVLPGSSNILSGEAVLVKNSRRGGPKSPELVEEILLEYGVPPMDQKRFMKLAWAENPKQMYHHTRMGNSWILRQHLTKAQQMRRAQDAWCQSAFDAEAKGDVEVMLKLADAAESAGITGPAALELDSTIGVLRGTVSVHVHCYKGHDIESLFHIAHEFGFTIQGLHHALQAWKVPDMLKNQTRNLTVATFASFGLFKEEAYDANLWAGKILSDQGVAVAYKSSITSVPAKALGIDHRVGYARPSFDADLVIWNSHPLSIGATPLQVYIDGREVLDPDVVSQSLSKIKPTLQYGLGKPQMRPVLASQEKAKICAGIKDSREVVITGINTSYLPVIPSSGRSNLTMIIRDGSLACFDYDAHCRPVYEGHKSIKLKNGFIMPGLTAMSSSLGMTEIILEGSTGDGLVGPPFDASNPRDVVHAKYGVHFEGKTFARARMAGITRAVSTPLTMVVGSGFWGGSSVGIKISEGMNSLNGGIFKEDVAIHFSIGKSIMMMSSVPTISSAVAKIRNILSDHLGQDNIYGLGANGTIPVVITAQNKYDILQVIKMKQDFPSVKFVVLGGGEASLVAKELAAADVPVILQSFRSGPSSWEKKDLHVGPPLSESQVSVLQQAGVLTGLSITGLGDSQIHNLPLEASWAGIYAGLSPEDSISLVSMNVEKILCLHVEEHKRDFVVYEGNPLQFGGSVAVTVDGETKKVVECWPEAQ